MQAQQNTNLACLILAAGKGTRMSSSRAKVVHEVLGAPLVSYPIRRAQELGASPIVAILGHQRELVERVIIERHGPKAVTVVEQASQKGTGHAVRLGLAPLGGWQGVVLILSGDVPLLRRETLAALVEEAQRTGGLAMLTARVADPTGYGRIVRDEAGRITRIVEHKDASEAERKIDEINAGIYAGPAAFVRESTARLVPQNAQGEYYLTDIVEQAARGLGVASVAVDHQDASGINDRRQLAEAEEVLRRRIVDVWNKEVTFRDPDDVVVEPDVVLGQDAEIGRGVVLRGRTKIGAGARVDDGAILTDVEVGPGALVGAYVVATETSVSTGARVPPLTRLGSGV